MGSRKSEELNRGSHFSAETEREDRPESTREDLNRHEARMVRARRSQPPNWAESLTTIKGPYFVFWGPRRRLALLGASRVAKEAVKRKIEAQNRILGIWALPTAFVRACVYAREYYCLRARELLVIFTLIRTTQKTVLLCSSTKGIIYGRFTTRCRRIRRR